MIKFYSNSNDVYFDWEQRSESRNMLLNKAYIIGYTVQDVDIQVTEALEEFPFFPPMYFVFLLSRKERLINQVRKLRDIFVRQYKLPHDCFERRFNKLNDNPIMDGIISDTLDLFFNYRYQEYFKE